MNVDMIERAKGMYSPMELQSRTIQNAVNIMASFAESETQAITAERDKYRDACERLIAQLENKIGSVAPVSTPRDIWIGEQNGFRYCRNRLRAILADDFARQVKAELEGIEGSEIEVVDE